MSYTNEDMPEWVERIYIDKLSWKRLEMEKEFYQNQHMEVVRKMHNLVDACKDYGYVEIAWGSKRFKFTMEEMT